MERSRHHAPDATTTGHETGMGYVTPGRADRQQGGQIAMREVDSVSLKTTFHIPDELFSEAERLASRLGMSRSALYAQAVAEFIARRRQDSVTERINEVLSRTVDQGLDPRLDAMQRASLPDDDKW